jgi:hypothetical protein
MVHEIYNVYVHPREFAPENRLFAGIATLVSKAVKFSNPVILCDAAASEP